MRAIDTNILVRILTEDDPVQAAKARDLVQAEPVSVATTVILETEWVLRSHYGFKRSAVLAALHRLIGHRNVRLTDQDAVLYALDLADAGMEFADALHLAGTRDCDAFVTFDKPMLKAARKVAGIHVETL